MNHQPPELGRRGRFVFGLVGALLVVALVAVVVLWPRLSYRPIRAECDRDHLVVGGGVDVSFNQQRRDLIRQWNESRYPDGRPHPPATMVEVSESADLQYSHAKAVAESESHGCTYDVLILDNNWTTQFASRDFLRPLTRSPDWHDFNPQALETGAHEGKQYALPFNVDIGLLYVPENMNPPSSWAEMLRIGFVAQLADYEGRTVNALEAVWNDGGEELLTGPDKPSVDELRGRVHPALMRLAARVRADGPLADSLRYHERESIEAFRGGDRLMRMWPYAFFRLAAEPRMREGNRLRFQVFALPGAATVMGGQNLAISKTSPNPGAAEELIRFLTGTAAQRQLFSCGGFAPARYSAFGLSRERPASADVQVPSCVSRAARQGDSATGLPDNAQLAQLARAIVVALDGARPRPATAYYGTFSDAFRTCVGRMFETGSGDAATFASAIGQSLRGRTNSCA